jgi:K+ transporter
MTSVRNNPKNNTTQNESLGALSLAALGVVYGDIGTSPLYVMKAVFDPAHGLALTDSNVMGVISLIFWAIMIVVTIKYITLFLRADNLGEGGIMALLSLAGSSMINRPHLRNTPLQPFLKSLLVNPPVRVAGTAIFVTSNVDGVPHALLHNLAHNQVLHECVVFLAVDYLEIPRIPDEERISIKPLTGNCYQVIVRYGFKDEPDIPAALEMCKQHGLECEPLKTSYFLSREIVVPTSSGGMTQWQERIFAAMARNAGNAAEYFKLPANRVLELGTRIEI